MRFDILTLFPGIFDGVFEHSIVGRARAAGRVEIHLHDIRAYAFDKHHVTDDTPYGGGGGMVMKVEPIMACLNEILGADTVAGQKATEHVEAPIALMTPAGEPFSQRMAHEFERIGRVVMICGRYEGVDERVSDLAVTHQVSLGDYVLSGGEIPAMAIVEAVTRLVPGVLGDMRAVIDDSHSTGLLEYPHYTRPFDYEGHTVPDVLLCGDHARVARWRRKQALARTLERRPDMLDAASLTDADRAMLRELAQERQANGDECEASP